MEPIISTLNFVRQGINNSLSTREPWKIIALTSSTVLAMTWLWEYINQTEYVTERAKKKFFKLIRYIPAIRRKIEEETNKVFSDMDKTVQERTKNMNYIVTIPEIGYDKEKIIKLVDENLSFGDYDWKNGHVSGSVYYDNQELIDLVTKVYGKTSYTNPLHPDVFPGLCKMEAEVVRMAAGLFHGDENTCGTMTTGGTESIMMACKAYRDYGANEKGIKKPEIVVPRTAHAAFDKSAQYLGLRVKSIPIDPYTTQVDIKAMEKAITGNTIMLVGSAPNFPYGTMDDIAAISDLGLKYNIPVHVDSCLGGFLTAFMDDAGYPIPPCDFRMPGVTSISADTHKYGFSPKGSSIVLYQDTKYRHSQYTVTTDWPGGVYGSPTISGSRAGGAIASCWATLLNFGRQGYVNATRDIIHTTKYIEKHLHKIKGIFIFGQPVTSVIALGSRDFEIYRLSTALSKNGWNLNVLQFPSAIHICLTHVHTQSGVADKFINDVKNAVTEILKDPTLPVVGKLAMYGVAQSVPDRSIVGDFTRYFLDTMYYTPKQIKKN